MIRRLGLALSLTLMWSCSGDDEQQPKEPVAAEQGKVPDNPGATADAAKAPEAPAVAAAPAAAAEPEKSTPPPAPAADAAPSAVAGGELVVKVGALNVRKGPGTNHAVVRTLKKGEHVSPVTCEKNWCKLAENEYVSKKFLKKDK